MSNISSDCCSFFYTIFLSYEISIFLYSCIFQCSSLFVSSSIIKILIINLTHIFIFLIQIKYHYENYEMTQDKLWMVTTLAMDTFMKIK